MIKKYRERILASRSQLDTNSMTEEFAEMIDSCILSIDSLQRELVVELVSWAITAEQSGIKADLDALPLVFDIWGYYCLLVEED